jgi:hypothetical protein
MTKALSSLLFCVLLFGGAAGEVLQQPVSDGNGDRANPEVQRRHEQIYQAQAKKRLDSLKADTDKLAQLSQELKRYVDQVNPDLMLSLEVVKKADEIEKLAKQVREKMKGQ